MTPHGSMHVAVGGFMGAFNTAGLDPLFWLHHCNIDRLWTVWLRRSPSHRNPTQALWLDGVKFAFRDATGSVVEHTSSQMVDTTVAPLLYDYDDVTDPLGGVPELVEVAVAERPIPEMVGATDRPVVLAGPSEARLSVVPPAGPGAHVEAAAPAPGEIYLNIENITGTDTGTGTGTITGYDVYLNVPPGADPEGHPELRIGRMPLFGLAEASRPDTAHAGNGLKYAYRIGSIVRRLQSESAWTADDVRISFVPRRPAVGPEAAPEPITVGRISIYVA